MKNLVITMLMFAMASSVLFAQIYNGPHGNTIPGAGPGMAQPAGGYGINPNDYQINNGQGINPNHYQINNSQGINPNQNNNAKNNGTSVGGYYNHGSGFGFNVNVNTNGNNTANPNNYPNNPVYYNTVNASQFNTFYTTLKNKVFEDDRKAYALQLASTYNFTSHQVKELANCMPFDDSKKTFIIRAYPYTLDKQNYEQVIETTPFPGTRSAIRRAIY